LLVDTASGVARSVDLAYLDELSTVARRIDLDETARKSAELNILGSAVRWHGVDFQPFIAMLEDTWRRVWCHLVIADHDVAKASGETMMFNSTLADIKIDYSSILDDNRFPNEKVCPTQGSTNAVT
jgi:hypothetical protein